MSNVKGKDKKQSKVEFDNVYYKIHDDGIFLIKNRFGAKGELAQSLGNYISVMSKKVLEDLFDIGKNIRIANSIYPTCYEEYVTRRIHQEKAIGLCFDLLTKYQLAMKTLQVPDDKYTVETKNLIHEINCLKNWKKADRKRFKDLG